ncbi:MAG TPA: hypothetical protein VM406_06825, partial [Noviherbaspirillum sp.]|nr:hypothetical protein [Noviherbaspirillum sp.]
MLPFDDCILGNSALHARFLATTEILARLVSSAPRKVHLTQLEDDTGRCAAEITACCAALGRAGLLTVHDGHEPAWSLAGTPALVTLEDVFCCVMNEQMPRAR